MHTDITTHRWWAQSSSSWRLLARVLVSQSRPQTLAALQWAGLGAMPIKQGTTQEYDDRTSTTERTLTAPGGLFHCPFHICFSHISSCFTVRLTFLFTTLVATRRCRCLLRSDYWWVVMPYRLAPCDLGDPGWGGIPGFRMVLVLLHSPSGMAWWFWCSSLCFCCHTMSRWYNVIISCMN